MQPIFILFNSNKLQFYKMPCNHLKKLCAFADFLSEKGSHPGFELYDDETLASELQLFYCCVRRKPKEGEQPSTYSRSAYQNIIAGLQRHLVSPPYNRMVDLRNDKVFQGANQVYDGMLKQMKREGKDTTHHKPAINEEDMKKFYQSEVLSNKDPVALQRKVFLEIALHFGRWGREGWQQLTKNSFEVCKDEYGKEYVKLKYNEFDKNHAGAEEKQQLMYASEEVATCPVYSFKLYISKLHQNCEAFLQRPNGKYKSSGIWYNNAPVGINTIAAMMKNISAD